MSENNEKENKYPEWVIEHAEKVLIMMNFRPSPVIRKLAIENLNDMTSKVESFGGIITWDKNKLLKISSENSWMKSAFPHLWEEYLSIKKSFRKT